MTNHFDNLHIKNSLKNCVNIFKTNSIKGKKSFFVCIVAGALTGVNHIVSAVKGKGNLQSKGSQEMAPLLPQQDLLQQQSPTHQVRDNRLSQFYRISLPHLAFLDSTGYISLYTVWYNYFLTSQFRLFYEF